MSDYVVIRGVASANRAALQERIKDATKAAAADGSHRHIKCCVGAPRCLAASMVPFPEMSIPAYCGTCDVWKVVPNGTVSKVTDPAA